MNAGRHSYYGTAYDGDVEIGLTNTQTTSLKFTPNAKVVKSGFDSVSGRSANGMESYYITLLDIINYLMICNIYQLIFKGDDL